MCDAASNSDDLAAIEEALSDMEAGDVGMTLDVFDARFRYKHHLSLDADQGARRKIATTPDERIE